MTLSTAAITGVCLVGAYLAGSINFSILLFKILQKGDPRDSHSKNPGATNVYRQAGPLWAAVVLVLDMGRAGAVAFAALLLMEPGFVTWAGLFLILGNHFPLFHGFKGGKGVANFLGFTMIISFPVALVSGAAWGLVYAVIKKPFIASFFMVAILAAGTILKIGTGPPPIAGSIITAFLIFYFHKDNITEIFFRK